MSFVICYCDLAFPIVQTEDLPDITTHMRNCPIRRAKSPIFDLIERLDQTANDQQRRVLLEELRVELGILGPLPSPLPLEAPRSSYRPSPLQQVPRHESFSAVPSEPPQSASLSGSQSAILQLCRYCGVYFGGGVIQLSTCNHWLCEDHIRKDFDNKFARRNLGCPAPGCNKQMREEDLAKVVGADRLRDLKRRYH